MDEKQPDFYDFNKSTNPQKSPPKKKTPPKKKKVVKKKPPVPKEKTPPIRNYTAPYVVGEKSSEEIRNQDEPSISDDYIPIEAGTRGRKKSTKYISYDDAVEFLKNEMLSSKKKFDDWYLREKPTDIPRFPYRYYIKEWKGWNHWLSNNNAWGGSSTQVQWVPYIEAIKYSHKLKLSSYTQWIEHCKLGLPKGIPTRPDLVYKTWRSWSAFLGTNAVEMIQARTELEKFNKVFYVIHRPGDPENILEFGVDHEGVFHFKERWDKDPFTIIRLYWLNIEHMEYLNNIINHLSVPYHYDNDKRMVPNVWEILYLFESKLQRVDMTKIGDHAKTAAKARAELRELDGLEEFSLDKETEDNNEDDYSSGDIDNNGISLF